MVIGYRVGKHREMGHIDQSIGGRPIKAKVSDQVNFENRVVDSNVSWTLGQCVWAYVTNGDLVECLSGAF